MHSIHLRRLVVNLSYELIIFASFLLGRVSLSPNSLEVVLKLLLLLGLCVLLNLPLFKLLLVHFQLVSFDPLDRICNGFVHLEKGWKQLIAALVTGHLGKE